MARASARSSGVVILIFRSEPGTTATGWPMCSSALGGLPGGEQEVAAEDLGGLGTPEPLAVECGDDATFLDSLDGRLHWCGDDGSADPCRCLQRCGDRGGRDEWPDGVVDGDQFEALGSGLEAGADGVLSSHPAGNHGQRAEAPAERLEDPLGLDNVVGMGHDDDRAEALIGLSSRGMRALRWPMRIPRPAAGMMRAAEGVTRRASRR